MASTIAVRLTQRELAVARLADVGYSTKRVSATLHLSPRTVETHLGRIYGKLGIHNRDELIDLRWELK